MKNLTKITNIALMSFVLAANANAIPSITDKVYLKAGVGMMNYGKFKKTENGYDEAKIKNSPIYNLGIGYRFTDSIRADLNFHYGVLNYKAEELKQKVKTMAGFVNGYYDFNFHKSIVPYLTAGVGLGRNDAGDLKLARNVGNLKGKSQTNFIWNAGAGVQYKFNKNFAVDLGYRYMDLGVTKTEDLGAIIKGGKQKIAGHQVMGSLVYSI